VLELEMFSKMFALLFLAALSVVEDREKRRPGSGGGTERCDWGGDDGGVKEERVKRAFLLNGNSAADQRDQK
jgi:hypothetical protein